MIYCMIKDYLSPEKNYQVFIAVIVIVTISTSLFFFYQYTQSNKIIKEYKSNYADLSVKYEASTNTSSILRNYYDEVSFNYQTLLTMFEDLNSYYEKLQSNYQTLETNYQELEIEYNEIILKNQAIIDNLQSELTSYEHMLDDMLNFRRKEILDINTVEIISRGNLSLSYDADFAGYIEISFNSSSNVVIWVGSSILSEIYYARIPFSFPDTAFGGSYFIPACEKIHIYIINPSETTNVIVEYLLTYHY